MGITGLWKVIEPTSTEIPLECLEGRKLAVDVSIWIYQAKMAYQSDQKNPHIRLLINRLCKLLFYKIRPVFVFDGPSVPELKRRVLESRRIKKINEENILTNKKKMHQIKQIASGTLTETELQKTVEDVILPPKRVLANDHYKDIPSTSRVDLETPSNNLLDRVYIESDDEDIVIIEPDQLQVKKDDEEPKQPDSLPESFYETITNITSNRSRRQTIDDLVEQRELMRKSRLHPRMIPSDSNDFSRFQMQRILKRGRLNQEIDKLARPSSAEETNIIGPDGTEHILTYANDIQIIENESKPDKIKKIDLSLDHFMMSVENEFKPQAPPVEDVKLLQKTVEDHIDSEDDVAFHSKTGLLEAIARKRIQKHYREEAEKSSDDELSDMIDVSDGGDEAVIENKVTKNDEWDPQRFDPIDESSNFDSTWERIRDADDEMTPQVYRELQELLTSCGIPWMEAPGEAEAQCVELERLGLVDGVISDDSDVWAFGVQRVYRHMFSKNRRVQRYGGGSNSNCKLFCLTREDYITIALLSGGDYSVGLNKIGAVGAIELIAEFVEKRPKLDELKNVEKRIVRLAEKVKDLFVSDDKSGLSKNVLILRKQVRKVNDDNFIESVCLNHEAIKSYLYPNVDSSLEKFRWKEVNIQLVKNCMRNKLGLDDPNMQTSLNIELNNAVEALERWNAFLLKNTSSQLRLDSFFARPCDQTMTFKWSKKVTDALTKISRKSNGTFVEAADKKASRKVVDKRPQVKLKRKRMKNGSKKEESTLNLSEDSD